MILSSSFYTVLSVTGFLAYVASHFLNKNNLAIFFQIGILFTQYQIIFQRIEFVNSTLNLLIGITAGLLIFIISFILTTPKPIQSFINYLKSLPACIKSTIVKKNISIHSATAIWEELFWRVCIQGILVNLLTFNTGIIATGVLFWLVHTHRFKKSVPRMIEMILFSFCLGYLFEISQSIVLCITIHFVRNILIICYRTHVVYYSEKLQY